MAATVGLAAFAIDQTASANQERPYSQTEGSLQAWKSKRGWAAAVVSFRNSPDKMLINSNKNAGDISSTVLRLAQKYELKSGSHACSEEGIPLANSAKTYQRFMQQISFLPSRKINGENKGFYATFLQCNDGRTALVLGNLDVNKWLNGERLHSIAFAHTHVPAGELSKALVPLLQRSGFNQYSSTTAEAQTKRAMDTVVQWRRAAQK